MSVFEGAEYLNNYITPRQLIPAACLRPRSTAPGLYPIMSRFVMTLDDGVEPTLEEEKSAYLTSSRSIRKRSPGPQSPTNPHVLLCFAPRGQLSSRSPAMTTHPQG